MDGGRRGEEGEQEDRPARLGCYFYSGDFEETATLLSKSFQWLFGHAQFFCDSL